MIRCYTLSFNLFTENVELSAISFTSVTISWVVPYISTWQYYTIQYGIEPNAFNLSGGILYSPPDTSLTNQAYSVAVQGLTQGTVYYMRVSSTFSFNIIYSDMVSFRTLEPGNISVMRNFVPFFTF